jgi:hypothetical protein
MERFVPVDLLRPLHEAPPRSTRARRASRQRRAGRPPARITANTSSHSSSSSSAPWMPGALPSAAMSAATGASTAQAATSMRTRLAASAWHPQASGAQPGGTVADAPWNAARRVCARIEATTLGLDIRRRDRPSALRVDLLRPRPGREPELRAAEAGAELEAERQRGAEEALQQYGDGLARAAELAGKVATNEDAGRRLRPEAGRPDRADRPLRSRSVAGQSVTPAGRPCAAPRRSAR